MVTCTLDGLNQLNQRGAAKEARVHFTSFSHLFYRLQFCVVEHKPQR